MLRMEFRFALRAVPGVCLAQVAPAQTTTATLSGIVRDSQGGVIPGVSINVVQIDTGQTRQVTSGHTGDYTISNLPIGNYRITASAQGFKKTVIGSITLQVNQAADVDLTMEVGAIAEEVTVS